MRKILTALLIAGLVYIDAVYFPGIASSQTLSTPANSVGLPIAAGPGQKVTIVPSGGTARVEYTTGSLADINNGVATWTTWPNGTVSASSNDTSAFQMFVRAVGLTGSATLTVDAADPSTIAFVASKPWRTQVYAGPVILCRSAVAVNAPANDTNENTLATCTVPAGAMGANGVLRIWHVWSVTNSGNNKTWRVRFSGASGTQYFSHAVTTIGTGSAVTMIANRGATGSQAGPTQGGGANGTGLGDIASTIATSSVDTTAATSVVISCQKATGSETCTLESFLVELMPSL